MKESELSIPVRKTYYELRKRHLRRVSRRKTFIKMGRISPILRKNTLHSDLKVALTLIEILLYRLSTNQKTSDE